MSLALRLRPRRIVIKIETLNPAADAARYLSALQKAIQELQVHPHLDNHADVYTLMELYNKLHPVPDETAFKKAFSIS